MGTGSIVEIALFPELHVGNGHQVFFIAVQQAFMVNHFFGGLLYLKTGFWFRT